MLPLDNDNIENFGVPYPTARQLKVGGCGGKQTERTADSTTPDTLTADKEDCGCSRKARQGKDNEGITNNSGSISGDAK